MLVKVLFILKRGDNLAYCGYTCELSCENCADIGDCSGICAYGCSGTCSGYCDNCSALGSCSGSCQSTCSGDCDNTCDDTCDGTCYLTCYNCAGLGDCSNSCVGSCSGTCSGTCSGSCDDTCYQVCADDCEGTCYLTCYSCANLGTCQTTCVTCAALSDCYTACTLTCTATCADDCTGGAYMTRPADFTGFTGVYSGAPVTNLTASDWNAFNNRLIAFAHYKGKKQQIGTFPAVSSGNTFTAAIYNQTVNGLNVLSSYITSPMPTTKSSGQEIYASYIQALKTALNSIT